jgi:hypothetical protein
VSPKHTSPNASHNWSEQAPSS